MSSATVASNLQSYFCYQCNRTVTLISTPNSDLSCPLCHGGFLEELDSSNNNNPNHPFILNPNPNPNPNLFFSSGPTTLYPDPFSLLFPPPQQQQQPHAPPLTAAFDPLLFLQSYIANLHASGLNFQFVVEPTDTTARVPGNFGDYFLGPGLEQLIQHLAENDPNRYGTPPAAKSAVDALPSVAVSEDVVNSESNSCAVCMIEFEVGSQAKQMPCKHLYHPDCILPWLQLHNSCPVCRYELPTDDQDYETRKTGGGSGGGEGSGSGGSSAGSPSGRTGERMFRISLPWPLGAFRGNNDGNVNGGSGGGSQTSYESLD